MGMRSFTVIFGTGLDWIGIGARINMHANARLFCCSTGYMYITHSYTLWNRTSFPSLRSHPFSRAWILNSPSLLSAAAA